MGMQNAPEILSIICILVNPFVIYYGMATPKKLAQIISGESCRRISVRIIFYLMRFLFPLSICFYARSITNCVSVT